MASYRTDNTTDGNCYEIDLELDSVGICSSSNQHRHRRHTNSGDMNKYKSNRNKQTSETSSPLVDSLYVGSTSQARGEGGESRGFVSSLRTAFSNRFRKPESQPALSTMPHFKQLSIGTENDVETYAKNEWATTLPFAQKMKNGYTEVKKRGYLKLRRIRGDNYCALRSVMFQILTSCDVTKSVLSRFPSEEAALRRLDGLGREYAGLLGEWQFGNNPKLRGDNRIESLKICIKTFYETVKRLDGKETNREKRDLLSEEMNHEEERLFLTDARLVETVKFFMFSHAEILYKKLGRGEDVPLWFTLLTLRGHSENLKEYYSHQLNRVGDSLGLEQVEMFLLGTSLNTKIRVYRLSSLNMDDFQTMYPSEDVGLIDGFQEIILCAEDDRHYNVVYKP